MTIDADNDRPDSEAFARERRLLGLIRERSFKRGKFRLASGRESELYFNLKPAMMAPEGAFLSAQALLRRAANLNPDFVGGLEMGVVPVLGALAALSHSQGTPLKTFFVRKTPKDHGTMDLVEGLAPSETLSGAKVLVVDDVATSGGSILRAIEAARNAGATVDTALVIIDREEGGTETLAKEGVALMSVFKGRDFL